MIKTTYLAELLGTFVFISVLLKSGNFSNLKPFIVGLGLIAGLILTTSESGGHLNPVVSVIMHLQGNQSVSNPTDLAGYVTAQLLGGIIALRLANAM